MQRERITDHIFVFRSDLYAQVTAGVVRTAAGTVLIDTLLYPEESLRISGFVESALDSKVTHVINSHFHADHTTGACFFPEAQVIAHRRCRELLDSRGRESLRALQESSPEFESVELVLPNIVFEDRMGLRVGETTFTLWSSPGHSPDSIVCLVDEASVLFAADTVMPIPYFVDGDSSDLKRSLLQLRGLTFENIVQGHGDIVLRGEAQEKLDGDLEYLDRLDRAVADAVAKGIDDLESCISAEDCGISHVLMNGLVRQLHVQNLQSTAERIRSGDHR